MKTAESTVRFKSMAHVDRCMHHVEKRVEFLLNRFRSYPDFPGVQTGYDSITGREFGPEDIASYSWINGRGLCVLSRFARRFESHRDELMRFAAHVADVINRQYDKLGASGFPFKTGLDGTVEGEPLPHNVRSYSDLYICFGLLEYGVFAGDDRCVQRAKTNYDRVMDALREGRFADETAPGVCRPEMENPWSVVLDLSNEFSRQLGDPVYSENGRIILHHVLDRFYVPEWNCLAEYVQNDGSPFRDPSGRFPVDPGHTAEFVSFSLEFLRRNPDPENSELKDVLKTLLLGVLEKGWNGKHGGIYKLIDGVSGKPMNQTMPWWIYPEAMLTLALAYQTFEEKRFIDELFKIEDFYFEHYLNPETQDGPIQNISAETGLPVDIPPACKFQDPEFHSGKNLLTITEVIERLNNGEKETL